MGEDASPGGSPARASAGSLKPPEAATGPSGSLARATCPQASLLLSLSPPQTPPHTHSVRTQCPSRSPAAPLPRLCRPGLWVPTPACGCQEPPGCRLPGGVTGGSSSGRCLISGGAGDSRRGPMQVERASLWFRHSGLCRSRPNLWFQVRTGNRHAERACGVEAGPGGDWLGPRLAE